MPQPPTTRERRQLLDTPVKLVTILAGLATIVGVYIAWKATSSGDDPPSPVSTVTSPAPDPTTTTLSATKQDYVRNADALCSEAFQDAGQVVGQVTSPIDRFEQITLIHQGLLIRWGQLEPPSADAAEVGRILQTYDRANDQAADAATAYRRGDSAGYAAAEAEGKRLEQQGSQLAEAYGFKVCSRLGG